MWVDGEHACGEHHSIVAPIIIKCAHIYFNLKLLTMESQKRCALFYFPFYFSGCFIIHNDSYLVLVLPLSLLLEWI